MVKFFFESIAILAIATAMNPGFCVNFKEVAYHIGKWTANLYVPSSRTVHLALGNDGDG